MSKNKSIEILAPSGSFESVKAAVRQGADAVYIGSLKFSARAYAANFDSAELEKAVKYCRLHSVKVHIAINTLISDSEMNDALEIAKQGYLLGADAFIIQDPGLALMIKKAYPDIALHASTQMSVHTPKAAQLLYSLGFERVVLAREMSRDEIKEVVESCDIETEVFVHGALCMCMSGQCYLSAMLGGRSGNRGRCAQPCRLPFSVPSGTGHDLSLKDNCIIDKLSELCSLGVTSAKIEGRMKRPEYVAAAVAACRHSADMKFADAKEIGRLQAVFSRSGFTDGYYQGKLGSEMFGTRSKDDVVSATDSLLNDIKAEYRSERQDNMVNFNLTICDNTSALLTANSGKHTVCIEGEIPQYARNTAISEEKCKAQLSKTGGTAFQIQEINVQISDGLTVPLSAVNAMRREALSELEKLITQPPKRRCIQPPYLEHMPYKRSSDLSFRAKFRSCDVPDCFKECEIVTVPLFSDINKIISLAERGFNVAVEIPRAFFGMEQKVKE
ncbi:MAG: U32 family peptidase, partial [Clostridia bacterium]|nr:U32 family peptidase [Clostridia bacterium]